jgi:hypothetical protein
MGKSSGLGMLSVGVFAAVLSLYLGGCISGLKATALSVLVLLPMSFNETKGIFVLTPPVVVGVVFAHWRNLGNRNGKLRNLFVVGIIGFLGLAASYNAATGFYEERGGLIGFFTDPEHGVLSYLMSGRPLPEVSLNERNYSTLVLEGKPPGLDDFSVRRIDTLMLAWDTLEQDPVRLALGVGPGNASLALGGKFDGQFAIWARLNDSYTLLNRMLWEVGVCGAILFGMFILFQGREALWLARSQIPRDRVFGAAWVGISLMALLSLPYKNLLDFSGLAVLFFFFAGVNVGLRGKRKESTLCMRGR